MEEYHLNGEYSGRVPQVSREEKILQAENFMCRGMEVWGSFIYAGTASSFSIDRTGNA